MSQSKRWVRVAYCRDIPPSEGRAVQVGGREIAVFNLGDRFLAVENRCPHQGGPLADGIVSAATVVCPLHAWKMSLETGKGLNGASALSCVDTFRTRVEGGIVSLEFIDNTSESEAVSRERLTATCLTPNEVSAMTD